MAGSKEIWYGIELDVKNISLLPEKNLNRMLLENLMVPAKEQNILTASLHMAPF